MIFYKQTLADTDLLYVMMHAISILNTNINRDLRDSKFSSLLYFYKLNEDIHVS